MSLTRVYRVGGWYGFVRLALLLVVILCWVDRCFDSWVLLRLFCLYRVTDSPHAILSVNLADWTYHDTRPHQV